MQSSPDDYPRCSQDLNKRRGLRKHAVPEIQSVKSGQKPAEHHRITKADTSELDGDFEEMAYGTAS